MQTITNKVFRSSTRQYKQLAVMWALRALVHAKGYEQIMHSRAFTDDAILRGIGLSRLIDKDISRRDGLRELGKRLKAVEQKKPRLNSGPLFENLEWLGRSLRLNKTEKIILAFLAITHSHNVLCESLDNTGDFTRERLIEVIATVINSARSRVSAAFDPNATLIASGIIKFDNNKHYFSNAIEIIDGFLDTILRAHRDSARMLDSFFCLSRQTQLRLEDFNYRADDINIVTRYLRKSQSRKKSRGVNILIYGRPGTGKTELARVISQSIDLDLYEITMNLDQGDAVEGEKRFSIYQLAQQLLARKDRAIILFDEMEDVFPESPFWLFGARSVNDGKKAWINRQLETNPVPTIWISNNIDHFDPAFLRRFDYIMELRAPTRTVRHRMLTTALQGVDISADWIDQMAASENLVPAHIERAARVLQTVSPGSRGQNEALLERVIGNTLTAMGEKHAPIGTSKLSTPYSIDLLNANEDLENLTAGLKRRRRGSLCFYGPPGTGKTAFADRLSQLIDRPIMKKRASDIFSMWVGQSEKNIASMFRQAQEEGAILFLDEADSFLQDRKNAHASWEVSQVNELLVQMEHFSGVFIAATNLMDTLDAASLRRFDLKVYFDYLQCDQAVELLKEIVNPDRGIDWSSIRLRLAQLDNLALGDFAALARRADVLGQQWCADEWLDVLEEECLAKPGAKRQPMGFLSASMVKQ